MEIVNYTDFRSNLKHWFDKVFNDVMNSELLYGFVPASISNTKNIHLITIKNSFPFLKQNFKKFTLSPFAGIATTLETGNHSFLKLPEKYPKGYYFPSGIHFTLYVGASFHKDFKKSKIIKGADLSFEFGTVETYLWYAITSKELAFYDVFSSAIGINLYF